MTEASPVAACFFPFLLIFNSMFIDMPIKVLFVDVSSGLLIHAKGSKNRERWPNSSVLAEDGGLDYSPFPNTCVCFVFVLRCVWLLCELLTFSKVREYLISLNINWGVWGILLLGVTSEKFKKHKIKKEFGIKWPEQGREEREPLIRDKNC